MGRARGGRARWEVMPIMGSRLALNGVVIGSLLLAIACSPGLPDRPRQVPMGIAPEGGGQIVAIHMDGRPPKAPPAPTPPPVTTQASVHRLSGIPAYTWCYGCSNTCAAMMFG